MTNAFHTTRRVDFSDTDMAGIVHFANFFRFMEAAEQEMLRSVGLSVSMHWEGESIGFPRVAASCDYVQPARFEDVLDIHVSIRKLGRKSVTCQFDFSKSGTTIARGQISTVCCRVASHEALESIEIPNAIRAKLHGLMGTP